MVPEYLKPVVSLHVVVFVSPDPALHTLHHNSEMRHSMSDTASGKGSIYKIFFCFVRFFLFSLNKHCGSGLRKTGKKAGLDRN